MAEYRIWPATNGPNGTANDGVPISQGTEFVVTSTGMFATKIWYWRGGLGQGTPGTVLGQVYRVDGPGVGTPLLGTPASFNPPATLGWQFIDITPVPLTISQHYKVVVYYPNQEYVASPGNNYWNAGGPGQFGITNGPLTAVSAPNATDGQSTYIEPSSGIKYPTSVFQSGNYWIDVSVSDLGSGVRKAAFMAFFQ